MKTNTRVILAMIAVGTFALTGCTTAPKVATLQTTAAAEGAVKDPLVEFQTCMGKNGVNVVIKDGKIAEKPTGVSEEQIMKAAYECREYAQAVTDAHPADKSALVTKQLEYAKCIREHGFPDYPDPDADGNSNPDTATLDAPGFKDAADKCRK